jgi:hypothetical protein
VDRGRAHRWLKANGIAYTEYQRSIAESLSALVPAFR